MTEFEPHPDCDDMTADEIRAAINDAEQDLKLAREVGNEDLKVWLTQKIRLLEAGLARRNGNNNGGECEQFSSYPYGVEDGRIVRYQSVKEGQVVSSPLCNFSAQIAEEVLLDDGAESHREFVIQGCLDTNAALTQARVTAARFPSMNWVGEAWGRRAIVNAGTSTKDHLRAAIQKLSPNARDRSVFAHTGWRKIGNRWTYLSGSTAGGNFEVELGTELVRYGMPAVAEDPVGAMKLSLSFLRLAPLRITAPLFAACYRAPLCAAYPQDLSVWLEGRTGSLKSTDGKAGLLSARHHHLHRRGASARAKLARANHRHRA